MKITFWHRVGIYLTIGVTLTFLALLHFGDDEITGGDRNPGWYVIMVLFWLPAVAVAAFVGALFIAGELIKRAVGFVDMLHKATETSPPDQKKDEQI